MKNIKEKIKNEHNDIVVKDFIDYACTLSKNIDVEKAKSYIYYFSNNPSSLDRLSNTVNKYVLSFVEKLLEENNHTDYLIFDNKVVIDKKVKNELLKKYRKDKELKQLLSVNLISNVR